MRDNIIISNDVKEVINEYVKNNFPFQKVLVIIDDEFYIDWQMKFNYISNNSKIEVMYSKITSREIFSYNQVENEAKNIPENIRLVIAIGYDNVINLAKNIAKIKNLKLIIVPTNICNAESFLNISFAINNGILIKYESIYPTKIIIDNNNFKQNRYEIAQNCWNFLSKLCFFVDYLTNADIFKTGLDLSLIKKIKLLYLEFDKCVNGLKYLDNNSLQRLIELNITLFELLDSCNYKDNDDKEFKFSSLYTYFNKTNKYLSREELKFLGGKIFISVYLKFWKDYKKLENWCCNLEKRVQLFDKCLKNTGFDYNFLQFNDKSLYYHILSKYGDKYLKIYNLINIIYNGLSQKIMLIYNDCGFKLNNNIDDNLSLQSLYFTPDILSNNSLLEIIKDYGALDFNFECV